MHHYYDMHRIRTGRNFSIARKRIQGIIVIDVKLQRLLKMGRNLFCKILGMACHCKVFASLGLYLTHAQIFAQTEKVNQTFESISDTFSAKSSAKDHQFGEFFLVLIAGAVLVFVIWLAYQFYAQRKQNLSPDSAWGLYEKLCQIHNLNQNERSVIRKVCRWNGLDDPLPLFVEPNYLKSVLADEAMLRFHEVVQGILDKLFRPGQELIEANRVHSEEKSDNGFHENRQKNLADHETPHRVEYQTGNAADDTAPVYFERSSASSSQENLSPFMTKVLLNPIPGHMAFSSLVEPVHQLTSEIASASIRHNLSDGRGMNERTYNGLGELRQTTPEPQSPLFPKSNVPSPGEMLANESRRTNPQSLVSPTPQYLKTHKETSPVVSGKSQSDLQHNPNATPAHRGQSVSFENIAMLETIVMER
jgi:hypothetical protein